MIPGLQSFPLGGIGKEEGVHLREDAAIQ